MKYKITGSAAKKPCLWCLVPLSDLRDPNSDSMSNYYDRRTLEMITSDAESCKSSGQTPHDAQKCNSVVHLPLFDLPLTNCVPPSKQIASFLLFSP